MACSDRCAAKALRCLAADLGQQLFLALAVALTLPLAVRNVKAVLASIPGKPESIATGDIMSAQLHLAFCALFGLALFAGTFLR